MRYIVAILPALALALPIASPAGDAIRLSEPVEVTDTHEVFGAPVGQLADATPLAEIIAASERHDGREVRATARVSQVCQKKGCFFIAQDGDAVARVTFADYGFFVPTDSGGKDVTIVGIFGRKVLSEAQARHFAEDAGQDPARVSGPREEYSIVATAVAVPIS
jgi:hypothetical protein